MENKKELEDCISVIKDNIRTDQDRDGAYERAWLLVNGKVYTDESEWTSI